jgi:glucose-6-phosphate isomerase
MATAQSLRDEGMSQADITRLTPHRSFAGNVPSNVLWLDALNPKTVGALVALYEHKVFCQAAIWGIHAYDQWGVELGKTMAKSMEQHAQA